VRDEIARLKSSQRSIVICTHNLVEAEALADIVAIIYRGHILMQGTLDELKQDILGPAEYEALLSEAWTPSRLDLPEGVSMKQMTETRLRFQIMQPHETNPLLVRALSAGNAPVVAFQEVPRTLEQAYLKVMAEAQGGTYAG
jgi:ABC-2 type transport system ATP-binding protein